MFDIVLALGGDGTVLYASWLFQRIVPPVLSFALGSLGFLTKFDYNDYKSVLSNAFHHGLTVSLRLRLEATVMRAQKKKGEIEQHDLVEELIGEEADDHHTHHPDGSYDILNDVVLDRGPNASKSRLAPSVQHGVTNTSQQCHPSKSSATITTSPQYKPTVSALQHRLEALHTIWPLEARSATLTIQSSCSQLSARIHYPSGQSFYPIRSCSA